MEPLTMGLLAGGALMGALGSKKSGKKEATSTNEPWKPQQPYLQRGYQDAQNWLDNQLKQNLPWEPPFSLVPQRNIYEQAYIDQLLAAIPGMQETIAQARGAFGNLMGGGVAAPYSGMIGPGLGAAFNATGAGTGAAKRGGGMGGSFNPMSASGIMPSYGQYQAPPPFTMREPQDETPKMRFPLGYNPMGNLGPALNKIAQGLPATSSELPPEMLVNSQSIDYQTPQTPAPVKPQADTETASDKEQRFMAGQIRDGEYPEYLKWWNAKGAGLMGGG